MISDEMAERVIELLETNAVMPVRGWEDRACVVHGRTGVYLVKNGYEGVRCDCMAGGDGHCSHAIASMIVWEEQIEARRKAAGLKRA